jgi:hypothetical protein
MNKLLLAVLLSSIAGALVWVGRGAPDASAGPGITRQPESPAAVFSVFGSVPRAGSIVRLESAARLRAERLVPAAAAVDPHLTRALRSDPTSVMYALAGDSAVCLHVEEGVPAGTRPRWGSSGCGSVPDTTRPMTSTTLLDGGRWHFSALVPDGIESVSVRTADGHSYELLVLDNAVSRELTSQPTRVEWTSGDGTRGSLEPWSDR